MKSLRFVVLPGSWGIARLESSAAVPPWVGSGAFVSVTRTDDELSIVCPDDAIPVPVRAERGWAALKLQGPFPFSELGVLASVASALAGAGVSLFAVSTFDTDYILVKREALPAALAAIEAAGHRREE